MATAVIMPRQGQSVENCIITSWNKKKGDRVEAGEILFSYETDKSAFDEPSPVSGTVLEIMYGEGDVVDCLENVCVIGEEGIFPPLSEAHHLHQPQRRSPRPPRRSEKRLRRRRSSERKPHGAETAYSFRRGRRILRFPPEPTCRRSRRADLTDA